jgi:hypothetical protein
VNSSTTDRVLEQRWDRIGLGVRCAYNPQRPEVLQHDVQAGRRLSRLKPSQEVRVQRRMLDLLLATAADEAPPWGWRAACLEHTAWPLARLTTLLEGIAGAPARGLEERVRHALDRLGVPPKARRAAAGEEHTRRHARR